MLLAGQPAAAEQGKRSERVASLAHVEFHSSFWVNLHHTLYAAAWARRPETAGTRPLAGRLPAPLTAAWQASEEAIWNDAVDFYDRELASLDIVRHPLMRAINDALATGRIDEPRIPMPVRAVLGRAAAVYLPHLWPEQDRANRAWIGATLTRLRTVAGETIEELERLYDVGWFMSPVRVDVVWVGARDGAYTTLAPTHAVISSSDARHTDWTSVEVVFHEVTHALVLPLQRELLKGLGDAAREHPAVSHVVQFQLTGAALQRVLRARGIDYSPYLYSTGLFERRWRDYRPTLETTWPLYVDGKITRAEAVRRTAAALAARR